MRTLVIRRQFTHTQRVPLSMYKDLTEPQAVAEEHDQPLDEKLDAMLLEITDEEGALLQADGLGKLVQLEETIEVVDE